MLRFAEKIDRAMSAPAWIRAFGQRVRFHSLASHLVFFGSRPRAIGSPGPLALVRAIVGTDALRPADLWQLLALCALTLTAQILAGSLFPAGGH